MRVPLSLDISSPPLWRREGDGWAWQMNWTLFKNSLLVSGLATLLSVAFGLTAAFWLAGLTTRWRMRWMAGAIAALALPPFLVSNCWMHYLGNGGSWHNWLPLNIYTLGGTVWVLALLTWPITLLAVLGAWRRLEPSQLESDMAVTGGMLVRGLLLPLARGALTQAAVLTFVLALNNFAVPALLQVKVYPAEAWVDFNTTFNALGTLETSWPMILVPILLLIWFRKREVAWPRVESPVPAKLFRQQLGKTWSRVCGAGTVLLALVLGGAAARTTGDDAADVVGTAVRRGSGADGDVEFIRPGGGGRDSVRGVGIDWLALAGGSGVVGAVLCAGRAAGHRADCGVQPANLRGVLSERGDCDTGLRHPVSGPGLERRGAGDAHDGPRFDGRGAVGGSVAVADAAARAMAADFAAGGGGVVHHFSTVLVGCGIDCFSHAAGRRDDGSADI